MTTIPLALISYNRHIELGRPKLLAVILNTMITSYHRDILQTMHCLEIVLTGSVEISKDKLYKKLGAGSIIFRKKGSYQIYPSFDYTSLLIFMENEFISGFLKEHVTTPGHLLNQRIEDSAHTFELNDFINANVAEIIKHLQHPVQYACCIIKSAVHQIMLQLLATDRTQRFISRLHQIAGERKVDIIYFMEENFTRALSIAEMASETARSVSVFKKEFVDKLNMSPMKWQINRRLEYAHFLINTSLDPVSIVAYNAGFGNLSHFSKAYKKKYGVAPSRARYELPVTV